MFGDGCTQRSPVSAQVIWRLQTRMLITARLQRGWTQPSELAIFAISPQVIPCTYGTGTWPMNEIQRGSMDGPSTRKPPSGLGRSSTTNSIPFSPADSMHLIIVLTYV